MCVNKTEQEEEVMICIPGSEPSICSTSLVQLQRNDIVLRFL